MRERGTGRTTGMLRAAVVAHGAGGRVLVVASDRRQVDCMRQALIAMGVERERQPRIVAVGQAADLLFGRFFDDIFFDHHVFEDRGSHAAWDQAFDLWRASRSRSRRIHA